MFWRLCLLLALAAVIPCSPSRTTDQGEQQQGRRLQQYLNATQCARAIPYCNQCRFLFYQGTTTKAICTQCEAGYAVRKKGRGCWCAPGYYRDDDKKNTCAPCGEAYYCTGSKLTITTGDSRVYCGDNKMTNTRYAQSARECLVKAGFGFALPDAIECPVGFYNPGYNNRKCTRCPGGLTTMGPRTTTLSRCIADAGYYYLRGAALACSRGTYKEEKGNYDCSKCPEGFTTPEGQVAQTTKTACAVLLPGYSANETVVPGVTSGTLCPEGSFRSVEVDTTGLTGPVPCTPCGTGMNTLAGAEGETSPSSCLVLPGYGYEGGSNATFPGSASICPLGFYNEGWNREECSSCGAGTISTDEPGSTSADDCFVPAGHGTNRSNDGKTLGGYPCPNNTYGRPENTYGLVDVDCTKCPLNTHTDGVGSTEGSACTTNPGYGWYDGQVIPCGFGSFNPGNNQNPCTQCGYGYNTSNENATAQTECQIGYGMTTDGNGGIKPCTRGFYKDTLGAGPCTTCPNGTTTISIVAAPALSECDACRPGYGVGSDPIDPSSPSCTACQSGFYSPGFIMGGTACTPCPSPPGYSGKMVSPLATFTPEYCVSEFPNDASFGLRNDQDYDVISMPIAAGYLELQASVSSLADCQAGCSNGSRCQYFEWRDYSAQCFFKLAPADIVNPTAINLAQDKSFLLISVKDNVYVSYLHDDSASVNSVGETLSWVYGSSLSAAVDMCNVVAACLGITHDNDDGANYRLFRGTKWEGAVGKVRAVGETLNAWIGPCSLCNTTGTASCDQGTCTCKPGFSGGNCASDGAAPAGLEAASTLGTDAPERLVAIVTSDGTFYRPYCSWVGRDAAGTCPWGFAEQSQCASAICLHAGFSDAVFVQGNEPCSSSSTVTQSGAYVVFVDENDARQAGGQQASQVTAICS